MKILVLAGGPDAEHDISLASARAVADALRRNHDVLYQEFRTITQDQLAALNADVVFPILHGPWGEGGPMQEMLETDARPYLGSRPAAAALAMDKLKTKSIAARLTHAEPQTRPLDTTTPPTLPCIIKPNAEGSSVGLYIIKTHDDWANALHSIQADTTPGRTWINEPFLQGPEFTVPLIDTGSSGGLTALPIIQITPAKGTYDFEAKYTRTDTTYTINPDIPEAFKARLTRTALDVANALGVRHLARVDFMLDKPPGPDAEPHLLEVNTMPGFTATSLLPKAAASIGLDMPALCDTLARVAYESRPTPEPMTHG